MLDAIFHRQPINLSVPDYDIVAAIAKHMSALPVQLSHVHVKGHQDTVSGATLDQWAQLNIAMDHLAKSHIPVAEHYQNQFQKSTPLFTQHLLNPIGSTNPQKMKTYMPLRTYQL